MNATVSDSAQAINLRATLDDAALNRYSVRIIALVILAMFVDGFDLAAMSFAAPALTRQWGLPVDAMGPVFSVSSFGMMIGGCVAALLSDFVGRRWTIILSALVCTITTFGTALARDLQSLTYWRLLNGVGIGALAPVCLVMANEYAPSRIRATALTLVFLGYAAGGKGWPAGSRRCWFPHMGGRYCSISAVLSRCWRRCC